MPESRLKAEIQAYIDACQVFRDATEAFCARLEDAKATQEATDAMQNDLLHAVEMTDLDAITPSGAMRLVERLGDMRRVRRDAKILVLNLNSPTMTGTLKKMSSRAQHLEQTLGDALKTLPTWYEPRTRLMPTILEELTSAGVHDKPDGIQPENLFDLRKLPGGVTALTDATGAIRIRQTDTESALRSLAARGGTLRPTMKNRRRLDELGRNQYNRFGEWCRDMLDQPDEVNLSHRTEAYEPDDALILDTAGDEWVVRDRKTDAVRSTHEDLGDALCALYGRDHVDLGEHLGACRRTVQTFDVTLAPLLDAWCDGLLEEKPLPVETADDAPAHITTLTVERDGDGVHLVKPDGLTLASFPTVQEAVDYALTTTHALSDPHTRLLEVIQSMTMQDGEPVAHARLDKSPTGNGTWRVDLGDRYLERADFAAALAVCEDNGFDLALDALTVWRLQRLADPSDWVRDQLRRATPTSLDNREHVVYRVTRVDGVHVIYADDVPVRVYTSYGDPVACLREHDITNIVWTTEFAMQLDLFIGSFPVKGQSGLRQWRAAVLRTHNKHRDKVFA